MKDTAAITSRPAPPAFYRHTASLALFAMSGMLALVLAMGVGRFAYTALLPQMLEEGLLSHARGAWLAGANYAGYLLGALWTALSRRANPVPRLLGALVASVLTTLAMGFDLGFAVWCVLRFVAGMASAVVYVYATGIVLRRLTAVGAPGWSALHYTGIGGGITLSAIVAQAMLDRQSPVGVGWWWLGALALLAAVCASLGLAPAGSRALSARETAAVQTQAKEPPPLGWLAAAYGLAGLGYIVSMTFLPVMLRGNAGTSTAALTGWLVVGIAAMPTTALWIRLGLWRGVYPALIACTLVQALGVALPVLVPGVTAALTGAALLGGSFMGIGGLAQWLARVPDPQASARRIGLLTVFFGLGQIAGPLMVAVLNRGADFTWPVLLATAALLGSAALLEVSRRIERLG